MVDPAVPYDKIPLQPQVAKFKNQAAKLLWVRIERMLKPKTKMVDSAVPFDKDPLQPQKVAKFKNQAA